MPTPPEQPKIYHILHKDRLANVLAAGGLYCDALMHQRQDLGTTIGMGRIKQRRLILPVKCYPETKVAEYVPFYYCPRSIMLYLIHKRNEDVAYKGGQGPIVHLEADLYKTIEWADNNNISWALSLANAGAFPTEFRSLREELEEINWPAVASRNFTLPGYSDGKQAEFLVKEFFPWELVERIGVHSQAIGEDVTRTLGQVAHRPIVEILTDWYY